ncbi:MAG: thiamine phosphate synthase [Rhodospirillales bacterium]|nr:MAG: thiamine phosphate synthase [Rhodospirillales bacterium]
MATLAEVARRLNWPHGQRHLPRLILMTDPERLPDPLAAIARLPRGAAVILRHADDRERAQVAARLAATCRRRGLRLLIAADPHLARACAADGLHLPERSLRHGSGVWRRLRRPGWLVTAAAHSAAAIAAATRAGVDAVLLSPVFPTASHPEAVPLGPVRFARLVRASRIPVYALGGIGGAAALRLKLSGAAGFAAIGGLADGPAQASAAGLSSRP